MQINVVLRVEFSTESQRESHLIVSSRKRSSLLKEIKGGIVKALTVVENGRSCLEIRRKMSGEF